MRMIEMPTPAVRARPRMLKEVYAVLRIFYPLISIDAPFMTLWNSRGWAKGRTDI